MALNAQGAAAGASAGAAFGPWGAAIGGIAGAFMGGGGNGGASSPAMSDQTASVGIDFSDWTVSTGGSNATGATDNTGLQVTPILMFGALALVAIVAVKWIKSK